MCALERCGQSEAGENSVILLTARDITLSALMNQDNSSEIPSPPLSRGLTSIAVAHHVLLLWEVRQQAQILFFSVVKRNGYSAPKRAWSYRIVRKRPYAHKMVTNHVPVLVSNTKGYQSTPRVFRRFHRDVLARTICQTQFVI